MRKLKVFNSVSLDGYFTDARGDMSWAHKQDPEWNAFSSENASGQGHLVFGRVTYDLMAGYWPTEAAKKQFPAIAKGMNDLPKIVFSRTLSDAKWQNTRVIKSDLEREVSKLKAEAGPDLVIMGSGTLVAQLTNARLVDEYQLVVVPVVLGAGRTMFERLEGKRELALKKTRPFGNGNVVLWYEPVT